MERTFNISITVHMVNFLYNKNHKKSTQINKQVLYKYTNAFNYQFSHYALCYRTYIPYHTILRITQIII